MLRDAEDGNMTGDHGECDEDPSSVDAIKARSRDLAAHNLLVYEAAKRSRGRPRLTEGEHPVGVKVNLPRAMADAIDATDQKRSTWIRQAIAERLDREGATIDEPG